MPKKKKPTKEDGSTNRPETDRLLGQADIGSDDRASSDDPNDDRSHDPEDDDGRPHS
jgi:hypothetical protein